MEVKKERWIIITHTIDGTARGSDKATGVEGAYEKAQRAVTKLKNEDGVRLRRLGERGVGRYWEGPDENNRLHRVYMEVKYCNPGEMRLELKKNGKNGK